MYILDNEWRRRKNFDSLSQVCEFSFVAPLDVVKPEKRKELIMKDLFKTFFKTNQFLSFKKTYREVAKIRIAMKNLKIEEVSVVKNSEF